jgi:hypothetical protein
MKSEIFGPTPEYCLQSKALSCMWPPGLARDHAIDRPFRDSAIAACQLLNRGVNTMSKLSPGVSKIGNALL